jgi:hypothetical protein
VRQLLGESYRDRQRQSHNECAEFQRATQQLRLFSDRANRRLQFEELGFVDKG